VWSRTSRILPSWPYTTREFVLSPDFTNQTNVVERYVRPFTIPTFTKYLKLTADEMEKGLVSYRKAALAAPPEKRRSAYREVLLAEQLERMLRSNDAVLEFETMPFPIGEDCRQAEPGRVARSDGSVGESGIGADARLP